ncbi:MAG: Uncharacterized protein FD166_855 [Bacteroidetes bacterium]|nr:MAG: Uncharacterized protein FD166_855 [Bacteroidota bacterium]
MNKQLANYLFKFSHLKQGVTPYGPAPHKPILLISLLQAFRSHLYTENRITVTPELVSLFTSNWNSLVKTNHVSTFALPFFHLRGEKFWHLSAKPGFEISLVNMKSISSLGQINTMIESVSLDYDLYMLFQDSYSNTILSEILLEKYFPETKIYLTTLKQIGYELFDDLKRKILNEDPAHYRAEIDRLIAENNEDEIFLRSNAFKRAIPRLYNNTCSISGLRITSTIDISMIDACHIIRWSDSHDDTRINGIALCPNLHRAFDRGLISIDDNYKLLISKVFQENASYYNIKQFEHKTILLPENEEDFPGLSNLAWHRKHIFKY